MKKAIVFRTEHQPPTPAPTILTCIRNITPPPVAVSIKPHHHHLSRTIQLSIMRDVKSSNRPEEQQVFDLFLAFSVLVLKRYGIVIFEQTKLLLRDTCYTPPSPM